MINPRIVWAKKSFNNANSAVESAINPCTESVGIDQGFLAAFVLALAVGLDDARRFPILLAKTRPGGEPRKICEA